MANLEGQTLGRYQLIERLGRGGMADVYKGYHPGLDRYVAVKVLHPHLSEDENFIERFGREAKAVASLRHNHIVQVFDFDSQEEHHFMVMEYVEGGQSLKERLAALRENGERFSLPHAIDITAKIAGALDYAHRQGMIHRDIKPANILMPTIDRPLLGDFGIARIVGKRGLTAEGSAIGTPSYMSPEQGKGEEVTERTDIYALGIVLYEMVTGRVPFDADTPYAIILKHINDPLVSPRELAPFLPDDLERVILKALAKDPADRFESASQMQGALQRTLDVLMEDTVEGEATQAINIDPAAETVDAQMREAEPLDPGTASTIPLEETPDQKKKLPYWVWGAVGLIALVAILAGLYFMTDIRHSFTTIGRAESAAERGDYATAYDLYQEAYDEGDSEYWILEDAAQLAARMKDYDQAAAFYDTIVADSNSDPHYVAGRAAIDFMQGNYDAAWGQLEPALSVAPDEPFGLYLFGLLLRDHHGQYEDAINVWSELVDKDEWEYAHPLFYPSLGYEINYDMALAYHGKGDDESALTMIGQSLENESWWVEPYLLRAAIYKNQGNLSAAREDLLQALEIAQDLGQGDKAANIQEQLAELGAAE